MKKWRLGLDMGTNSIGWTAVSLEESGEFALLGGGSRVFSDGREEKSGVPLNEERRMMRLSRRQRDRKIKRKKALFGVLIESGLIPGDKTEQQKIAKLDPYELRNAALERKLEPFELGRVLAHFAARRGFKSNRKDVSKENESEKKGMKAGIESLSAELDGLTLGQWLFQQKKAEKSVRFKAEIEKAKALYDFYPSREMYEAEFAAIRSKQEPFYEKNEKLNWEHLHKITFFQRPIASPERGKCEFYPEESRAYKACVSFQRFRILQDIHNLAFCDSKNKVREIPYDLKRKLFDKLWTQESMSFNAVKTFFNKICGGSSDSLFAEFSSIDYTSGSFNLESGKRDELKGNALAVFRKPEYFGDVWDSFSLEKQDEIIEKLINEDDEAKLIADLMQLGVSESQAWKISAYEKLPKGVGNLSSRFLIECSDIMLNKALPYHEAVAAMGLHHSAKEKRRLEKSLPYYGKVLTGLVSGANGKAEDGEEKQYGRIANPTVHIALNQLRKLANALMRRFGPPSEIILEVGRELKQSKAQKERIEREQTANQKNNERIKEILEKEHKFVSVDREYIKKFKLWEELGKDGATRCCLYCGKNISASQIFSPDIEIEHILPYSRTLCNTFDNLTVAHRSCNQAKGNRSPFEAFGNSPEGFDWEQIVELSKNLPLSKRRKFFENAMDRYKEEEGGFITRQITDTAYLSKAGKDYLSAICDRNAIWVSSGRMTALLRGMWGFNTLLNRGRDSWFKNRSDHRHHFIDSLVIAFCDRKLIATAARVNANKGYRDIDPPPCPIKRETIEQKLVDIIVSHKRDHGKEGKLFKETALSKRSFLEEIPSKELKEVEICRIASLSVRKDIELLVQELGYKKAKPVFTKKYQTLRVYCDKFVTRAPLTSLSERDIPNIADLNIRKQLLEFEPDKNLEERLLHFSQEKKIYSVRYFPKDQTPIRIQSVPNKWYMSADFYRVDVWRIPQKKGKCKYEGVFIPRVEAEKKPADGKPHPAAKFMMSLYKGDVIELSNETIKKELSLVKGFSTTNNAIDIRPIAASGDIADWFKDTREKLTSNFSPRSNKMPQNYKSINKLFSEYRVRLANITVDGKIFYQGRKNYDDEKE